MGYFIIKAKLPSLNDVIDKNRANKYMAAQFKRDIETTIGYSIKQALTAKQISPMRETPCIVRIYWHEKTMRRDVDNIQSAKKFILDAMQKEGIIQKDSRRYVKQVYDEIIDDTEDFVVVEVTPYGTD